jgi:hypothetical protein
MPVSFAALTAAVCVSTASFAQPPAAGAAPPVSAAAHEHWAEHRRERAEAHAQALRAILNLRPDQEAAFRAFQAAMNPPGRPEDMHKHHDQDGRRRLATPERLDRMAARMAERQAEFQRRAAAIKTFYAALNPEQQRAFDALPGLIGSGGRRHGDGGGRGHFEGSDHKG